MSNRPLILIATAGGAKAINADETTPGSSENTILPADHSDFTVANAKLAGTTENVTSVAAESTVTYSTGKVYFATKGAANEGAISEINMPDKTKSGDADKPDLADDAIEDLVIV